MEDQELARLLMAATSTVFALSNQIHQIHLNVLGTGAVSIHKLTDDDYNALFGYVDTYAELLIAATNCQPNTSLQDHITQSYLTDQRLTGSVVDLLPKAVEGHQIMYQILSSVVDVATALKKQDVVETASSGMVYHKHYQFLYGLEIGKPRKLLP